MFNIAFIGNNTFDVVFNADQQFQLRGMLPFVPIESRDYNRLVNKPKVNGVTLVGNLTSADLGIDQTYTHVQAQASDRWVIVHGLHKCPSITVVDSAGTVVVGAPQYIDENTIVCSFSGAFSGKAYLN